MGTSVLIIDDEPRITGALMTRLTAVGYEVNHAINGLAGVEAAALHRPDVIVLDIGMPDIDGFDTFERITRMNDLRGTPVVFLSGDSQESMRQRAADIGGAAFLSKPFESADVIAVIERVTEQAAELMEGEHDG